MRIRIIKSIGLLLAMLVLKYAIFHIEYGVSYGLDFPDNKHTVMVDTCKEDKSSNVSYIKGIWRFQKIVFITF